MNSVDYNDIIHSLKELHQTLLCSDSITLTSPVTILKYLTDNIPILSSSSYYLILSLLIDHPYSIIQFLKNIYQNDHLIKEKVWTSAREHAFELLDEVLKGIYYSGKSNELDQKLYMRVLDMCQQAFFIDPSNQVKKTILSPLTYSLERFVKNPHLVTQSNHSIQQIYDSLFKELMRGKSGNGVKAALIKFLCRQLRDFPTLLQHEALRMLKCCIDMLKKEASSATPKEKIIANIFLALKYFLMEFSALLEREDCEILYMYICKALEQRKASRYDVPKSALKLLAHHAQIFEEFIVVDISKFFDRIQLLCNHINDKVRKEAFPAMEAVLGVVSRCLCKTTTFNENQTKTIFLSVIEKVEKLLMMHGQGYQKYNRQCAIFAVGGFASPIAKYRGKEALKNILLEHFVYAERLMSSSDEELSENIHLLPSFFMMFANIILIMDSVEYCVYSNLEKLFVVLFASLGKHFDTPKQQYRVHTSIVRLLLSFSTKSDGVQKLLSNIFPQGLKMALTSRVLGNMEGPNNAPDLFLQIWLFALKSEHYPIDTWTYPWNTLQIGKSDFVRILSSIHDQIMESIICIMDKLDLRVVYKELDEDLEIVPKDTKETETEGFNFSDLINHVRPSNEKDYELFNSLVDFQSNLINYAKSDYMWRWTERLCSFLTHKSLENPFISGFYKLLHSVMHCAEQCQYFKGVDINSKTGNDMVDEEDGLFSVEWPARVSCYNIIQSYCKQTITRLHEFKGELLLSVIQFLLSVPLHMHSQEGCTIPLNLAFKQGLSYLPLAKIGLTALEKWIDTIPPCNLRTLLEHTLPNLNAYLCFKDEKDYDEHEGTDSLGRDSIRNKIFEKAELTPLKNIQLRIIRLLAKLGSENAWILNDNELLSSLLTSWDLQPRVQFKFPFRDSKPTFFFDSLLPRVMELAETSGDRNAKIAACEFLHTIVILMIGTNAVNPNSKLTADVKKPTNFFKVYTHVLPVLIRLAVDNDPVCRNLFEPLIIQIVHWFTQTMEYEHMETMALLDCIIDSLCTTQDGAIRDLCATLLNEFLRWSIKHDRSKKYNNVESLFQRLYSHASHPNMFKRLGSIVALNKMYRTFRENTTLVGKYALDWLHIAVKCMNMTQNIDENDLLTSQVTSLLRHIEKIIVYRSALLIESSTDRGYHKDLNDALQWLLQQCGSVHKVTRIECMKLISSLVICLPDYETNDGVKRWIVAYILQFGLPPSYMMCQDELSTLLGENNVTSVIDWMLALSSSLHIASWLISANIVEANSLLTRHDFPLSKHLISFLKLICLPKPQKFFDLTLDQERHFQEIRTQTILGMFTFFRILILGDIIIFRELFSDVLNKFMFLPLLLAIIHPQILGFNTIVKSSRIELASVSESFLRSLLDTSEGATYRDQLARIYSLTSTQGGRDITKFDIRSNCLTLDLTTVWFRGLRLLHRLNILSQAIDENEVAMNLLIHTANTYYSLDPSQIHTAQELLELSFEIGSINAKLFELILADNTIQSEKRQFFSTFSGEILKCIAKNLEYFIPLFMSHTHIPTVLQVLSGISSYFLKNVKGREKFVELMVSNCIDPEHFFSLKLDQKLTILQCFESIRFFYPENLFLRFDTKFLAQIYLKCIRSPTTSNNIHLLSLKSIAMQAIPSLVKSSYAETTLESVEQIIKNEFPVTLVELSNDTDIFERYTKLLEILLFAMQASAHIDLCCVLLKLFRWTNHPQKRRMNRALDVTLSKMIPKDILKLSLECFSIFQNDVYPPTYRASMIQWVSIECLSRMPEESLKEYYKITISNIIQIVEKEMSIDIANNLQDVTSLTCAYNLLECMFRTLPAHIIKDTINIEYCKYKGKSLNNLQGNELTSAVLRSAYATRKSKIQGEVSLLELRQSSYNVLAGAVMCTQTKEKLFNSFLFASQNKDLWDHIVDKNIVLEFPIESKFDIFVQAINKLRIDMTSTNTKVSEHRYAAYLSTQYLADSSLSGDISFIGSFYIPGSSFINDEYTDMDGDIIMTDATDMDISKKEKIARIDDDTSALEMDLINQNPCMPTVLRVIDFMNTKFNNPANGVMPEWMKDMYSVLNDHGTHDNIRYFLAKVIINRPNLFHPYCQEFFESLVSIATNPHCSTKGIHYFLRDICMLFLNWENLNPGNSLNGRATASKFVEHMMKNAPHAQKVILRNNLEMIKILVEKWKPFIRVNRKIVLGWIRYQSKEAEHVARATGLQLLGVLLANDISLYEPEVDSLYISETKFYESIIQNINYPKVKVSDAAAEICGMYLRNLSHQENSESYQLFSEIVCQHMFQILSGSKYERFLRILGKVSIHHEIFLDKFLPYRLMDILPKLVGVNKQTALQLIYCRAEHFSDLYIHLKPYITGNFESLDESIQLITLQIIHKIARFMDDASIISFIELIFESGKRLERIFSELCRLKLFEVLMWIYDNIVSPNCKEIARSAILRGLSDPSQNVRKSILSFWDHESRLSIDSLTRLEQIFKWLYSADVGFKWLQHSSFLILQLAHRSPDFESPTAIFPEPLSNCEFKSHNIDTTDRSLASTFSISPSFQTQTTPQEESNQIGQILATQNNSFSLTMKYSQDIQSLLSNSSLISSSLLFEPFKNEEKKKEAFQSDGNIVPVAPRRRFPSIKESSKTHVHIRRAMRLKQEKEAWTLKQKQRRHTKLNLYRSYKTGELPYIQISYKDLLEPLQALCIHDAQVAKNLFVLLVDAILTDAQDIKNPKHSILRKSRDILANEIATIVEESSDDTILINAMWNLCLKQPHLRSSLTESPLVVASISSYNIELGILLYESMIERSIANIQKLKANAVSDEDREMIKGQEQAQYEAYIRLARLYSELGEEDIVRGIFESHCTHQEITIQALSYERDSFFKDAHKMYQKALDSVKGVDQEDLLEEITFWEFRNLHCMKMLTNWDELSTKLVSIICGNPPVHHLDQVWEMEHHDFYIPLLLESFIKQPKHWDELTEFIDISMEYPISRRKLESTYPHQLSIISLIKDNPVSAKVHILSAYSHFLHEWSSLSFLSRQNRINQLSLLQSQLEIEEYINIQQSSSKQVGIQQLLQKWKRRLPDKKNDNVSTWDNVLVIRLMLLENLEKSLSVFESGVRQDLRAQINDSRLHILLNASIAAQNQDNLTVSQEYLKQFQGYWKILHSENNSSTPFNMQFFESLVNLFLLRSRKQCNINSSMKILSKVINYIETSKTDLVNYNSEDGPRIYNVMMAESYFEVASRMHDADITSSSIGTIEDVLKITYDKFSSVCNVNSNAKEHLKLYHRMASICDLIIENGMRSNVRFDTLAATSTRNVLLALKHNGSNAKMLFPKLLKYISQSEDARQAFEKQWKDIPKWIFLSWFSQMIPLLNGPEGVSIIDSLESVVCSFNQGTYFPWKISKDDLKPQSEIVKQKIEKISKILYLPEIEKLIVELGRLTNPNHRWDIWRNKILQCMDTGGVNLLQLWRMCFDDVFDINLPGQVNSSFAQSWAPRIKKDFGGRDGQKLLSIDKKRFSKISHSISQDMRRSCNGKIGKQRLADYAPYLSDYQHPHDYSSRIALPGQYEMIEKHPEEDSLVYVTSFDPSLLVLTSIRRPKRLTIRGNDEKDYQFLVKGGEDLRQDQRIEQLFSFMNSLLQKNSASRKKGLSLTTYKVIPMTKDVGVLEWVNNTIPLKAVIENQLARTEQKTLTKLKAYQIFEEMLETTKEKQHIRYLASYKMHSMQFVTQYLLREYGIAMQKNGRSKHIGGLKKSLLKDALQSMAASQESFFRIRDKFGKSLSAFNICSYILGIGDRHLENFLLDSTNGGVIGIDFGHAFGSATENLPIPDLTPFRLTRQLIDVFSPLTTSHERALEIMLKTGKSQTIATGGILIENMECTMSTLRNAKESLYAIMEIFVREPLVDWLVTAKSQPNEKIQSEIPVDERPFESERASVDNVNVDKLWYPDRKLLLAKRKLNLWNPSSIVVSDLENNRHLKGSKYLPYVIKTARGDPKYNIRAQVEERCSTVRQQIEALIDLATDPTILTRNYVGWGPFI